MLSMFKNNATCRWCNAKVDNKLNKYMQVQTQNPWDVAEDDVAPGATASASSASSVSSKYPDNILCADHCFRQMSIL